MIRYAVLVLLGVTIGVAGSFSYQKWLRSGDQPIFVIVDGDTVRINQVRVTNQRIRAVGYDTPEIFSAKCEKEKALGLRARAYLQRAVDEDRFTAELTGKYGGFGRPLAVFKVDGKDLGPQLIAEGLAVKYVRGQKKDWCAS